MTLDQRRDMTVVGATKQIAFPMAGNGAILNLRGPFPNGDGIDDLTSGLSASLSVP